ncbi:MAG: cytochrome c [Acidobacteria bacterium]|nr:cytochrome c [Acidobacteriota bacterium]
MASKSARSILQPLGPGALVLAVLALLAFHTGAFAAQQWHEPASADEAAVTFTRDVAPILQENCQICHRPGSVGPMSLLTHEQVRLYAPLIKDKVAAREMPPYHLDTGVGIQAIKNDWRLSEEEIATIVAWVDAGAPEGDPADMPAAVEWPDFRKWQLEDRLGKPDHVIKSKPFTVPAEGGDLWWRPRVETGLTEDRLVRALEVRPSFPAGRQAVHHAIPRLLSQNEEGEWVRTGSLSEYAMGKVGEILPADAARLLPANSMIEWDAHYYPMGYVIEDDQLELGLWFYPDGYEAEFTQNLRLYPLQGDIALAPGGTAMTQGFRRWDHPVRIDSFQPHGHVHLHAMSMEAIYPDGSRELLSMVSNFNARWHHSYIYDDDASPMLPTGTVLVLTAWYDNTEANPLTPDPEVWYSRGSRTTDEMSHAWLAITHLDEDSYERLVTERERKKEAGGQGSDGRN